MCGSIAQVRQRAEYVPKLGWPVEEERQWVGGDRVAHYNIAPGTHPWLLHRLGEGGALAMDTVHWGYQPSWAAEKKIPMAINARIEKAATGRYFRHMWKSGRAIVPADCWYEWTGEKGRKQPWCIRLETERPMFLAAITNFKPFNESPEGTGFVIVTTAAEAGLADLHDRRPVILSAQDAQLWMAPDLPAD